MFKQVFGHPSRKSITIAFLNDLLHRKDENRITDVQYENTELPKDEEGGKTSRLDILVQTSDGEKINVEIQLVNQRDMPERVLYYWSRLFSSSIGSGENYSNLTPTIMISILNYPLFPHETDSFHNIFHLREDTEHFLWSKHLEFHIFDLSKFMLKWKKYKREMKENPPLELPWMMMLSIADYKMKTINYDIFQELEEIAMNEHEVREALIEWETLSANKENKILYEARLKYLRDQLSNIMGERREGREEGRKEGREEVIGKMIKNGMEIETIADILECSVEEIRKLKQKTN